MSENTNRRGFLRNICTAGGAMTLSTLLGCKPGTESTTKKPVDPNQQGRNIFDILQDDGYYFKGKNGEIINMNALTSALENQYVTVSFGFQKCQGLCKKINSSLAGLDAPRDNLTSIIINVDKDDPEHPEAQDAYRDSHDSYVNQLKGQYGIKHDVLILYPVNKDGQPDTSRVPELAMKCGAKILNKAAPKSHTDRVTLYAPGGDFISSQPTRSQDVERFSENWKNSLNAQRGKY